MQRDAWWLPIWCEAHDVPKSKAYQLVASGELQTFKVGRRRFVSAAESRRFFERLEAAEREAQDWEEGGA